MSMVLAIREDSLRGPFIGFELDYELLECGICCDDAAYRIRYTADQRGQLDEHRFQVMNIINREHPHHSEEIRVV